MALWQFTLDLIPASAARVDGVDAIRLAREQRDASKLNIPTDELNRLFAALSSLLPEKQSWAPALRIWGDEKTDDVQVWFDGSDIVSVQTRLDARDLSLSLVGG